MIFYPKNHYYLWGGFFGCNFATEVNEIVFSSTFCFSAHLYFVILLLINVEL